MDAPRRKRPKSVTTFDAGCAENETPCSTMVALTPPKMGNSLNVPNVIPVVVVVMFPEFNSKPADEAVAVNVVNVCVCLPVFWAV